MNICQKIEDAKCCVAGLSNVYVKACTLGGNTNEMFYELVLLNAYIEALERHECGCHSCERCLTDDQVCFILSQISVKCESFACGC